MNRTVVLFQSKYGSTQKYAEWIAEELSCDIKMRQNVKLGDLEPYGTIIYGGGLYAGGVSGIDILTKNFDKLCNKNLILFTCGLADPKNKENTDHIKQSLNKVLTAPMQQKIKVFHLRGGMDYAKLNPMHRGMMAMLHKMIMKKDHASLRDEDREMLDTYGKSVDFVDRTTIFPIIDYVKGL